MGGACPSRERQLADKLATARAVGSDLRRRIAHGDLESTVMFTEFERAARHFSVFAQPAIEPAVYVRRAGQWVFGETRVQVRLNLRGQRRYAGGQRGGGRRAAEYARLVHVGKGVLTMPHLWPSRGPQT